MKRIPTWFRKRASKDDPFDDLDAEDTSIGDILDSPDVQKVLGIEEKLLNPKDPPPEVQREITYAMANHAMPIAIRMARDGHDMDSITVAMLDALWAQGQVCRMERRGVVEDSEYSYVESMEIRFVVENQVWYATWFMRSRRRGMPATVSWNFGNIDFFLPSGVRRDNPQTATPEGNVTGEYVLRQVIEDARYSSSQTSGEHDYETTQSFIDRLSQENRIVHQPVGSRLMTDPQTRRSFFLTEFTVALAGNTEPALRFVFVNEIMSENSPRIPVRGNVVYLGDGEAVSDAWDYIVEMIRFSARHSDPEPRRRDPSRLGSGLRQAILESMEDVRHVAEEGRDACFNLFLNNMRQGGFDCATLRITAERIDDSGETYIYRHRFQMMARSMDVYGHPSFQDFVLVFQVIYGGRVEEISAAIGQVSTGEAPASVWRENQGNSKEMPPIPRTYQGRRNRTRTGSTILTAIDEKTRDDHIAQDLLESREIVPFPPKKTKKPLQRKIAGWFSRSQYEFDDEDDISDLVDKIFGRSIPRKTPDETAKEIAEHIYELFRYGASVPELEEIINADLSSVGWRPASAHVIGVHGSGGGTTMFSLNSIASKGDGSSGASSYTLILKGSMYPIRRLGELLEDTGRKVWTSSPQESGTHDQENRPENEFGAISEHISALNRAIINSRTTHWNTPSDGERFFMQSLQDQGYIAALADGRVRSNRWDEAFPDGRISRNFRISLVNGRDPSSPVTNWVIRYVPTDNTGAFSIFQDPLDNMRPVDS